MATCDDAAENNTPRPKVLFPGEKILYKERYEYATFSGKVNSVGLTVGHIGDGESAELHDAKDKQVIEKILKRIDGTIKTEDDDEFTADISFLEMSSCCKVYNILRCFDLNTKKLVGEYRLVLHKDAVFINDPVMVLDEFGFMQQGVIKKTQFFCKANGTGKEVINALSIVDENDHAIPESKRSGALVTSRPQPGSDVLRVYGIVTHVHESDDKSTSATIANRLWDVLKTCYNSGHCSKVWLSDALEGIDFAAD